MVVDKSYSYPLEGEGRRNACNQIRPTGRKSSATWDESIKIKGKIANTKQAGLEYDCKEKKRKEIDRQKYIVPKRLMKEDYQKSDTRI